jgi:hypothetical protein
MFSIINKWDKLEWRVDVVTIGIRDVSFRIDHVSAKLVF